MSLTNSCPTLGLFNYTGCVTEFDSVSMLNSDQDYSIFSDKLYCSKGSKLKSVSHSNHEIRLANNVKRVHLISSNMTNQ